MTLIAVIIPTYHRNDLLALCLNCLAPEVQTLSTDRYEVIVTDDGSKTTAAQMIASCYPWAKWVAGPRKGPAANRNNGARVASGEWLAFTDDDCLPSPEWLEAFANALTPKVSVYEGKTTCRSRQPTATEQSPINLTGGWLWSCNMCIAKNVFEDIGGFDENYPYPHMEDTDLRERLKQAGYHFPFVENAVVDHPPRTQYWKARAASQESEMLYWYKRGHQKRFALLMILRYIKGRVLTILNSRPSRASLRSSVWLLLEVIYLISHVYQWERKYRGIYLSAASLATR